MIIELSFNSSWPVHERLGTFKSFIFFYDDCDLRSTVFHKQRGLIHMDETHKLETCKFIVCFTSDNIVQKKMTAQTAQ